MRAVVVQDPAKPRQCSCPPIRGEIPHRAHRPLPPAPQAWDLDAGEQHERPPAPVHTAGLLVPRRLRLRLRAEGVMGLADGFPSFGQPTHALRPAPEGSGQSVGGGYRYAQAVKPARDSRRPGTTRASGLHIHYLGD